MFSSNTLLMFSFAGEEREIGVVCYVADNSRLE
jgi:hypothetical protein